MRVRLERQDTSGERLEDKILATIYLPLGMTSLGELLVALGQIFPGSKVRPGTSSLEMEVFLPKGTLN